MQELIQGLSAAHFERFRINLGEKRPLLEMKVDVDLNISLSVAHQFMRATRGLNATVGTWAIPEIAPDFAAHAVSTSTRLRPFSLAR